MEEMRTSSHLTNSPRSAAARTLQCLVFIIVMTYASLLLIVARVGDASYYALLVVALLAALCGIRPANIRFTELLKHYWPIHLAMAGQFIAVFINQAAGDGFHARVFDLPSRMALFPVLVWAILLLPYKVLRYVRWAFVLGTMFALIKMGLITDWGDTRNHAGFLSIIAFAEMAMLLGFFSLLTLAWQEPAPIRRAALILKLLTGAAGLYIAYLSQTRGAWISIPVLLLIAIWVLKGSRRSLRHQLTWFFAATVLLGCLFISSHIVRERVSLVQSETADYIAGKNRDTSIGIRIQLWQGSWILFTRHPVTGIGIENFKNGMQDLARGGVISEAASAFPHSHNEALYNMTVLGLTGLIGLLALYLVPLRHFAARLDSEDDEARSIAGMGIVLCIGFFSFGLVDVMFMWRPSDNFYALMMALILACAIRQKQDGAKPMAVASPPSASALQPAASLVPRQLLEKSGKILFISHFAIGDYTYLQSCFQALKKAWPDLEIHLWIDELRRTDNASEWPALKKYALYDWLSASPVFSRLYTETYSPESFERSVREAQSEHYPIVVSLSVVHHHRYVLLARRISPAGFIVAQRKRGPLFDVRKHLVYRKLDADIPAYKPEKADRHISAIYAGWFEKMFGLSISEKSLAPTISIPQQWLEYADRRFQEWEFGPETHPVIFLNSFAKSADRSWPLERMIELIHAVRQQGAWRKAAFIINAMPEDMGHVRRLLLQQNLDDIALFSADENFFQLPAIMSKCDLVVSVETGVMHLANAVHVPVLALMRQKNPEWAPFDVDNSTVIKVPEADDKISSITVDQVLQELLRILNRGEKWKADAGDAGTNEGRKTKTH